LVRQLSGILAVFLFVGIAQAATDAWIAEMEEDEGGSIMVASIDGAPVGDITPRLRLMCAGDEGVNLRYETAKGMTEPGTEADFRFENESTQVDKHMQFEDMDGAFAAYFPPSDPMIELLKGGKDVIVSATNGDYPAQTFALKGSTKAINTLLKSCQ
jgi:hypothetical protein